MLAATVARRLVDMPLTGFAVAGATASARRHRHHPDALDIARIACAARVASIGGAPDAVLIRRRPAGRPARRLRGVTATSGRQDGVVAHPPSPANADTIVAMRRADLTRSRPAVAA